MRKNKIVAVRRARQLQEFAPPTTFDIYMQNNRAYMTGAKEMNKFIGTNVYKYKTPERN
jgi:hypothetical protein